MAHGTAAARLKKSILFWLVGLAQLLVCYRCKRSINTEKDLSVEHKVPWQSSPDPKKAFFDLENIAFSHHSCNSGAAHSANKRYLDKAEWRRARAASTRKWRMSISPETRKQKRREEYLRNRW